MYSKEMIRLKFISFYLLINSSMVIVTNSNECISFEVLLTQNIENLGFHRDLKWLLEITHPSSDTIFEHGCNFIMRLDLPRGAFVNPDQLADLQRMGVLQTLVDGAVDVEVFDHDATELTVYVLIEAKDLTKVLLTIPFHLRYQRAQISGGYGKVTLSKPSLLAKCSKKRKLCEKETVLAPCSLDVNEKCRWINVTYKSPFNEQVDELMVPVGDLDHYPLVAIVTLSIGCIGCIYILSLLSLFSKR